MSRWAVIVVCGDDVTVVGAYLWRWRADLIARAMTQVLDRQDADHLKVWVVAAGWREVSRQFGFAKRAMR